MGISKDSKPTIGSRAFTFEQFICLPMIITSADGYEIEICATCRFREFGREHTMGYSRGRNRYDV